MNGQAATQLVPAEHVESLTHLARGEKVLPYAEWLNKYKEKLLRQLAAAVRDY